MRRIHLLDVGSTSIKYACYDPQTRARSDEASCPFPAPCRAQTPFFEVEPEQIVQAVKQLLRAVRQGDQVRLCVQMHGYLLCNEKVEPVTPYISWRDQRSLLMPDQQRYPFDLPPSCGVGYKSNLPLAGLFAMKARMPEVLEDASMFCTLGSYLALRFTGQNASHITDLTPTGLYDAESGAARPVGFEQLSRPMVCMTPQAVGSYAGALWYAAVGDQQASTAGSGLKPHQYLLNLGTAAQMCALSEQPIYGDFESRPYFGGKTLCTVTGLIGGRDYAYWSERDGAKALARNYADACRRLPKRVGIRATGGVCVHHRALVEETLERIGLAWEIAAHGDALDGLIRVMEECEDDE